MRSPIKLQTAFFLFLVLTLPVRLFAWDLLNVITGTSDYTISEDDIKIVPLINAKNIFEAINDLFFQRFILFFNEAFPFFYVHKVGNIKLFHLF